ncbi:hypothetical protein [Amycolatopsis sp. NPDC051716]|jgi:hypothetical protein|uniref:hypothetical protein n=1 Tax=Amycolatopsis sp. NPDC051716 TaxID=3155804 RepID=UPI003446EC79
MEVTADGSPVDVYLLLPPNGEAEIVHAAVPPDASILELGSGAGRVTHPLLELGHQVRRTSESRPSAPASASDSSAANPPPSCSSVT